LGVYRNHLVCPSVCLTICLAQLLLNKQTDIVAITQLQYLRIILKEDNQSDIFQGRQLNLRSYLNNAGRGYFVS